ncbi:Na+/H+ antiporter [Actinomadura fulvescens]|uniref:Na+/H+ antiporter n=1 Tax=Actinomadura fulvescens TaxID=46160 RepID=A0ABP6CQN9_9ACTN
MGEERIFVVFLVIALVVLVARALSARLGVPDAILLVVLGVGAGFVPGLPRVTVPPEVVLMGFLPPLVYHAAFFTAPREARADAVPIFTLAFGLTTVTTLAVAGTTYALLPGVGWAAAVAFGAAVAPTDAVSATSVLQRLGAPPRLVTILEGESLINDGVALTIFGLAVESLSTPFTIGHGAARLLQVVVGGVAYGLLVGWAVRKVRRRIRDPSSQIIALLMIPYLAYIPAENLGVSGVLATVTAGFYLGTRGEGILQPASRLAGSMFWRILIFLLESTLFVLLGLEIRALLQDPGDHSWTEIAVVTLAVSAVLVLVRLLWELFNGPLAALLPGGRRVQRGLDWRRRLVIGLSGMRGAISLAIALSLPLAAGRDRGMLIVLAALVVMVTLVGQAPLLPFLLRGLGLIESDRRIMEVMAARKAGLQAALARLDELADDDEVDEATADTYRQMLELRIEGLQNRLDEEDTSRPSPPPGRARVKSELVKAQRAKLDGLYRRGKIGADTLRQVGLELDFQDPGVTGSARDAQRE